MIANWVFEADTFRVRPYEVKQWIEYMLYAGVEHVYWYDTTHDRSESQQRSLGMYVDKYPSDARSEELLLAEVPVGL